MEQSFIKHIDEFFKNLMEKDDFRMKTEFNKDQSYMIEYSSKNFVIKIEKYFRELYVCLYKENDPDNGIALFNLLEYLKEGSINVPKSEFFRKEKDIEECYRKQLNYVSDVINENYAEINDFFSSDDYDSKIVEFDKYWKNKHPELY